MEGNNNIRPGKKRKLRWGRLLLLLVSYSVLLTVAFWSSVWIYDNLINPPHVNVTVAEESKVSEEKLRDRINVLLLGVDDGDSEAGESEPKRTDAILLLSFDPQKNDVALLSIPRDTNVVLPGHRDTDKINAAYAYGGVVMAKQTVANLLKVPVHYYVLANWRGFIDCVNLIGGVDIYVEKDMYYEDPYADLLINIKHGYQHMDGKTAGEYVRFREDELGDIGRVQRQQKFLKAAAEQIFSIQNLPKISSLMAMLGKYVETDLNTLTLLKAVNSFKFFGDDKIRSGMLYGQFDDTTGISYWNTDRESVNRSLDELKIPHMDDSDKDEKESDEKSQEKGEET
ncbi:MAG: LCP family protein [Phascolarctobacterium sp.]|nr:LCP family protein [Phascolarctobacterium sp.]